MRGKLKVGQSLIGLPFLDKKVTKNQDCSQKAKNCSLELKVYKLASLKQNKLSSRSKLQFSSRFLQKVGW
ncbi:MAG: hypothetical protein H6Q16_2095 [Bacteroidetes bacterium]|nr:hypothetical protein [Bacteroidota bacterium]